MSWPKLTKPPTVKITPDGRVEILGGSCHYLAE